MTVTFNRLAGEALKQKPLVSVGREAFAEAGGLIGYAVNIVDL